MLDDAPDPVRAVFETVAASAPEIRAGLPGRRVGTDEENVSGEQVTAADRWADQLLGDRLGNIEGVGEYASEERETVQDTGARSAPDSRVEPGDVDAGLSVAVDPLDGSSNLKSNNPMGTIVGVYDGSLPTGGRDLVAAGFVLYGPITTMVVAHDGRAREYVIDDGEPADTGALELPEDPTVYGFGGRVPDWPEDFAAYVEAVERELKLRYGGAMIADVSQVLTYGGIFAYPGLRSRSEGKLRLLFEGAPIGYVVEAAGGASSDGSQSLLDVEPESLHQRVPVHVGNVELIERLEAALGE